MTSVAQNTPVSEKRVTVLSLLFFSFIVGGIAGFGAIVFRHMIGFITNLAFSGRLDFYFNENHHLPKSVFGVGIILVPVLGALLVTWLTQTFAPEAQGHGVPEVMDAIYYREGKIRPVVALIKAIASAISIGTGGSVGREGPIIQIGAAFASLLGQLTKISPRQRIVLIAAGAAAGIAATFNTPIGGLVFAIELMLVSISAVNVAMVAVATVTATLIGNFFIGVSPAFYVAGLSSPLSHALSPLLLLSFIPFGVVMGLMAALFIHSIYWMEDQSARLIKNPYFRHMLGMLCLGIILSLLMQFSGQYYVAGVGYATIIDILKNLLTSPLFLLLLCVLKILSTSLTLGTGASGGVFSPALFIGATLGAAYGGVLHALCPGLHVPVVLFAVTGMAAMVGGSTGAVLTAITMTFEQTRDYADILPMMLSVALTYVVRVKITNESIYTLKLYRRGLSLPQGLQAAVSAAKKVTDFMEKRFSIVDREGVDIWLQQQSSESKPQCAVIIEKGKVIGAIRKELNYLISDVDAESVIEKAFLILPEKTTWQAALRRMNEDNANIILVLKQGRVIRPKNILGIVTRHEIFNSSQEFVNLFG